MAGANIFRRYQDNRWNNNYRKKSDRVQVSLSLDHIILNLQDANHLDTYPVDRGNLTEEATFVNEKFGI
jgi:hypothetical protein